MNRLEEKLGRECTDLDFDVQQELLERTQREVRELKAIIWAIAWNAPDRCVEFFSSDADPFAIKDTNHFEIEKRDYSMTTVIRAARNSLKARPSPDDTQ